jgi:hypothetical protein
MVVVIGALAGMTTRTGQHLTGSQIKDIFADGVGKSPMQAVALIADIIDRTFEHSWVVRTMRRMAIVACVCFHVFVFCRVVLLESCFVTIATDVTFFTFEQPSVIAGMRGMTRYAAVILVTDQVAMRGSHLITDLGMAFETGIDQNRGALNRVAILAAFSIGLVQYISDQCRTIAAMRIVTGTTFTQFGRIISVVLSH